MVKFHLLVKPQPSFKVRISIKTCIIVVLSDSIKQFFRMAKVMGVPKRVDPVSLKSIFRLGHCACMMSTHFKRVYSDIRAVVEVKVVDA